MTLKATKEETKTIEPVEEKVAPPVPLDRIKCLDGRLIARFDTLTAKQLDGRCGEWIVNTSDGKFTACDPDEIKEGSPGYVAWKLK